MYEAAASCKDIARVPVTNREPRYVTLAGYYYAVRYGMKVKLVIRYRVGHLQRCGVTARDNVTIVYPPLNVLTFMTPIFVFRYTYTPRLCTCLMFYLVGSHIQHNCIQKVLDSDSGGITNYSKLPNSMLSLPSPDKDNLSLWSVLSLGRLLSYFRLQ
jgi:hypothetical protein